MTLRRSLWLSLAGLSVACGSGPASPPQAPSVPAPAQASGAVVPAPPPPDLGAVADPEGLVLVGKVSKLSDMLATLTAWTGKPLSPNEVVSEVIADEAAPFVDTEAPLDFAVLVTPAGFQLRPRTAVSLALRDPGVDGTRLADRFKLVPQGNGVSLIQATGSHHGEAEGDDDNADLNACEVAPAFGPAPTRLVCASNAKALAELGPWLTRTATRAVVAADVTVNVRMHPLRALMKVGRGLASSFVHAEIDRHLGRVPVVKELGGIVVDDLIDFGIDLDTATIELGTADSQLSLSAALKFSSHQSTLTRLLTSHPERTAPAPAIFWQLPADANAASFSRGADESEIARFRTVLGDVVRRAFDKDSGVKEPEQKLIVDATGKLLSPAQGVWACGFDDVALNNAIAAAQALGPKSTRRQQDAAGAEVVEARLGWLVGAVETPATDVTSRIKDIGGDLDRIAAAFAVHLKSVSNMLPILRSAPLPKGPQWPPTAQHFVLTLPAGDPPTSRVMGHAPTLHIAVVPDGARTWFAVDSRVEPLAKRLAETMAAKGKNLGSLSELSAFRSEVGAGGFFTTRIAEAFKGRREALPHQGKVPIAFSITAQPGGDAVVMTLRVPKDAIEDMSAGSHRWLP